MEAARAAEIIDELDSDVQADVIGELDVVDADAILSNMDAEDAEREIERTPHREWSDPLEFLDQAE